MSINKVFLCGNLTRDPEVKEVKGGHIACRFSLAVTSKIRTKEGIKEEVLFVDCSNMFNDVAKRCQDGLKKGSMVTIEGRLRLNIWQDKETGKERNKIEVAVETVHFEFKKKEVEQKQEQKTDWDDMPF